MSGSNYESQWFHHYSSSYKLSDKEKFILSKFTEEECVSLIPINNAINTHKMSVVDSIVIVFNAMLAERSKC